MLYIILPAEHGDGFSHGVNGACVAPLPSGGVSICVIRKWLCLQWRPADLSPAVTQTLSLTRLPSLYPGCADLLAAPQTHQASSCLRALARDALPPPPRNFLCVASWPPHHLAQFSVQMLLYPRGLCEIANPCLSPSSLLWVIFLPDICCYLPFVWVGGAAHRMTEVAHEPQELRQSAVNSVLCPREWREMTQIGKNTPLGESEGGHFANEKEQAIIRWCESNGMEIPPPRPRMGAESVWFGGSHR